MNTYLVYYTQLKCELIEAENKDIAAEIFDTYFMGAIIDIEESHISWHVDLIDEDQTELD